MNEARIDQPDQNLSSKNHIAVLLLFLLVSIIYTWPLALNLKYTSEEDAVMFTHSFWWFKKALLSLNNPFYTDYIFYPEGVSLAFQASTFSNFLITLPFNLLFSESVAVNIAFMLTYILSAYFTFLLAHRLTRSIPASILAGIIFSFSPYHFIHGVDHLNLSTFQWLPLYLLLLYNLFSAPACKRSVYAGLALGIIILTDHFLTINAFLLTVLLFITVAAHTLASPREVRWKHVRRLLGHGTVLFATACLASGFYLYQVVRTRLQTPDMLKFDIFGRGGANMFSGDLVGYLLPPSYHPIFGGLLANNGINGEQIAFLGFIPLTLAFVALVRYRANRTVIFIATLGILFWILSFGVSLHVNGVWQWDGTTYKLPFYYLTDLPVIGEVRTPVRFILITYLGIALLSAYALAWISGRIGTRRGVVIASSLICMGVLVEYLPAYPYKVVKSNVPAIYEKIALDSEPYTLLELPLSRWYGIYKNGSGSPSHMMFYQQVHNKKICNGLVTRATRDVLEFKHEILNALTELTAYENYQVMGAEKRRATQREVLEARAMGYRMSPGWGQFIGRYNIKYILIHPPISYEGSMTRAFVESVSGAQPQMLNNDGVVFYSVGR